MRGTLHQDKSTCVEDLDTLCGTFLMHVIVNNSMSMVGSSFGVGTVMRRYVIIEINFLFRFLMNETLIAT